MNKKLIVLILFIFLLLSTVVISILGKNPDPPIVRVDSISFYPNEGDNYEIVDDILIVTIDITDLEKENDKYVIKYQLNCIVTPENAANKIILYNIYNTSDKQYASVSSDGLVTIERDSKVSYDYIIIAKSADSAVKAECKMIIRLHIKQVDNPW